MALTLIFIWII